MGDNGICADRAAVVVIQAEAAFEPFTDDFFIPVRRTVNHACAQRAQVLAEFVLGEERIFFRQGAFKDIAVILAGDELIRPFVLQTEQACLRL